MSEFSLLSAKTLLTTKNLAQQSRNRNSDYLPQRRKGRKGRKNNGEKFSKIIHLLPPNLACFAPWRESIPRVRVFQITGEFAQAAQTSSYSNTKGSNTFILTFVLFVTFVVKCHCHSSAP
jgi:hypothetical protein